MRYDYIDLCKRLAAWYGGKLELVGLDSLSLYEPEAEHAEFVRATIWKIFETEQEPLDMSRVDKFTHAYGYSALVGTVAKGNKAACKGLLEFLLAKTWSETAYGTWPTKIYDKAWLFKQNWIKFDDLRMLDVELTLRGV